ncbi:uncharacterized protein Cadr_000024378 [Camelus dromedarius]|uniref:Uncharacterized protein n=1 Tax=Camelus dromedarius TaxID=9838 RepID=A0A5N4CNN2_CAMDR|nr:uncharacterized protein Cadr_000024378 [Camelus dromedarius]
MHKQMRVSVPRFGKIPWFSEASLINKPLVFSLPRRFLTVFIDRLRQVAYEAGRTQRDPVLIRNKQLCSTCQEKKMVRPTTVVIPDDLKLPFANLVDRRMMHPHPPKAQALPKRSRDDIPTALLFHVLLIDLFRWVYSPLFTPSPLQTSLALLHVNVRRPCPFFSHYPPESVHHRLPILGPRTAVFHGLLSDAFTALQETQLSSLPRKGPMDKSVRQ